MVTNDELIAQTQEGKAFQGKQELIRHYQGKRLTMSEAIKANCYECMGYYDAGAEDCGCPQCPLYPFAHTRDVKTPKGFYRTRLRQRCVRGPLRRN